MAPLLSNGMVDAIRADIVCSIRAKSAEIQRYLDLLKSSNATTRIAALSEMGRSADPAPVEVVVEAGLASEDPALRAIAMRAAFRPVRSIVAKIAEPSPPTTDGKEVLKNCGGGVQ